MKDSFLKIISRFSIKHWKKIARLSIAGADSEILAILPLLQTLCVLASAVMVSR
jgi:hypothetical protein